MEIVTMVNPCSCDHFHTTSSVARSSPFKYTCVESGNISVSLSTNLGDRFWSKRSFMTGLLVTDVHGLQHSSNMPEYLPSSSRENLLVFLVWSYQQPNMTTHHTP